MVRIVLSPWRSIWNWRGSLPVAQNSQARGEIRRTPAYAHLQREVEKAEPYLDLFQGAYESKVQALYKVIVRVVKSEKIPSAFSACNFGGQAPVQLLRIGMESCAPSPLSAALLTDNDRSNIFPPLLVRARMQGGASPKRGPLSSVGVIEPIPNQFELRCLRLDHE
jgi:hypothetical protein